MNFLPLFFKLCSILSQVDIYILLLQEVSAVYRLAAFPMQPVVYAGAGLCMLALLATVVTLISCFRSGLS